MAISVPDKSDTFIPLLLKKIGVENYPILLKVIPDENTKVLDCFPNVENKVKNEGGKMILGWQCWKSNNLIEAEFHAVWESNEKQLIDITPKSIADIQHTLFIVDERLRYEGKQRDNIRINITQNKIVDDFILICEAIFKFENKGERAYQYQYELKLSNIEKEQYQKLKALKELYQIMITNNFSKNTRCLCGSGDKFKHCHGKNLVKTLSHLI